MRITIEQSIDKHIETIQKNVYSNIENIEYLTELIISVNNNSGKIFICGNGGSASDSIHFNAELIVRYSKERKPIPSICLNTDIGVLTACSNDYSFEEVFSRQLQALGNSGDLLIAFSTSGKSKNVLKAIEVAEEKNMYTVGFCGKTAMNTDLDILINSENTARIQECHSLIYHLVCEELDNNIDQLK